MVSNLFFNLIRKRNFFLLNVFWLGIIALFLYDDEGLAFQRTLVALMLNLIVYLFLLMQSKRYHLQKR